MLTAKELYDIGSDLTLSSNDGPVKATSMRLVEKDSETFTISLENGMTHTITKYHKVLTKSKKGNTTKCLSDLSVGDYVAIQTKEGVFGNVDMQKEAFLLGMYHGDGTQSNDGKTIHFDLWENDFDLTDEIENDIDYIYKKYNLNISDSGKNQFASGWNVHCNTPKFVSCNTGVSSVKKKRLGSARLSSVLDFKKGFIPSWVWQGTKETQWSYIRGLLYTDGTAFVSNCKGNPIQINISSINRDHLKEIQLILANLGVQTSIRINHIGGVRKLPDGKGGIKEYNTKDCYRIIIGNKNDALKIDNFTGFLKRKNISIENRVYRDNTKKFYKISSIESAGRQDVYCVGVHTDQHLWICNGVVTHNCIEIMEPTSEERTAVCCLSSLNLEKYDEWKDNPLIVRDCLEMLDNVLSFFIEKAPDEIARAKFSAMRERSVGLGVLGFHAYLQSKGIPFESALAKGVNLKIFKDLREKIDAANLQLGSERGEAPDAKGSGKRLGLTSAIAPNACVTGDTKILTSDNSSISFYELGEKMGVDMESFENISVDLEDGQSIEFHLGASLLVERNGQ
jgi:ribonucleoside-diphosphate reductase alpha chain